MNFGLYLKEKGVSSSTALNDYICHTYEYFSSLKGIDKERLRDIMLIDRISTNSSDIIPSCLKREDKRLSVIKAKLKKELSHKGTISVGILYSTNEIIYCTYERKHPINGVYDTKAIPLSFFTNKDEI